MLGPAAIAEGTQIGRYRVIAKVGSGGAGTVYAAEDGETGARVAVKVLRPAFVDDATAKARFLREARAVNEVDHPAIVGVRDTGTLADGRPYLVLPFLEGQSLRDALGARGRFPPKRQRTKRAFGARSWTMSRVFMRALCKLSSRIGADDEVLGLLRDRSAPVQGKRDACDLETLRRRSVDAGMGADRD